MLVADAMTPRSEVITVSLPGTREDVLEYLQERKFSSVPVVKGDGDEERYRGLISREDLIDRPDEDQLAVLMGDVPTTSAEDDLETVAELMVDTGARRVPVVDGGPLVGIITITDIVAAFATGDVSDGDHRVGELARRDVNCTYVGTPLAVAERELAHAEVPYAVVLDDDCRIAGVLTEVDILDVAEVVEGEERAGDSIANQDDDWMWEGIKAVGNSYLPTRNVEIPAAPVSEFMTAELETVSGRRTVKEVAQTLMQHDIEQIPLIEGDDLVGIVRDVDLLKAL